MATAVYDAAKRLIQNANTRIYVLQVNESGTASIAEVSRCDMRMEQEEVRDMFGGIVHPGYRRHVIEADLVNIRQAPYFETVAYLTLLGINRP